MGPGPQAGHHTMAAFFLETGAPAPTPSSCDTMALEVQAHYNAAARESSHRRRESAHLNLRRFHNQLKQRLFQEAAPPTPTSVLDLGLSGLHDSRMQ